MILAISIIKGVHIAGIVLWAAGLIALPFLLSWHKVDDNQHAYQRIRRFSHYGYTHLLTPAAVIAVTAGTALIFLRGAFVPWMFAKLVLVGGLVILHAFIGNVVVRMGEHNNRKQPPMMIPLVLLVATLCTAIFVLVLSKPDYDLQMPEWLTTPRERQLPVEEVPIW